MTASRFWDTLAIAEYLNEVKPESGLLPADRAARARCRSISGEMHHGFSNLRSALPMNLKGHYPGFKVWSGAQADIDRIVTIWRECFAGYQGPYLFGKHPCMADAMYAPVVTRFLTYHVRLDADCADYCQTIMALPHMQEWAARTEGAGRDARARRRVLRKRSVRTDESRRASQPAPPFPHYMRATSSRGRTARRR